MSSNTLIIHTAHPATTGLTSELENASLGPVEITNPEAEGDNADGL